MTTDFETFASVAGHVLLCIGSQSLCTGSYTDNSIISSELTEKQRDLQPATAGLQDVPKKPGKASLCTVKKTWQASKESSST